MPTETLTDVRVRTAAPPKKGILEIWDSKTGGLAFRIMKSGTRSWTFRYWLPDGKTNRRVTIGRFPNISLADARAAAERIRNQVRGGADPQQDRQDRREAAATALTFDALCDLYLEQIKRHKSSWKNDEGYLRTDARPAWGERAAATITRPDVAKLLLDVVARTPTGANRLRSVMVTMFTWAVDNSLLEASPMVGVKKPAKEGPGKTRTLRDDEIRVLWNAFDRAWDQGRTAPGIVAALKTVLLLGQRPGEVAGMAVDELHDLNSTASALWALPAHRMKARKAHVVPLPPLAREIVLAELARQRHLDPVVEPEFVFASKFTERERLARHSLSQALSRIIEDLDDSGADANTVVKLKADPPTPHDLRRSVATGLSRLDVPRDDRLAVLAHSYGDVHEVYDQYDRLPQKRLALVTWERHIRKVISGKPAGGAKVIALRQQAVSP